MYQPRQNTFIFRFFSWYISFILKKDFHQLHFNSLAIEKGKSMLLLSNHFSWWDGFILFHLNKLLFNKQFHILVNTENYRKVGFLKYLGAFAPQHKGKDILSTIEYAANLLSKPENLVVIFPQGKLQSNHQKEIAFEQGVLRIMEKCPQETQIIFAAHFADYFAMRKPSLYSYLKIDNQHYEELTELNAAYNKHYEQSLVKQTQITK